MKSNIGSADKIIRIVVALIIGVFYFMGMIEGVLGIVLLILGAVFLLTSVAGICPLYLPFGFSTKEKKS